MNSFTPVPVLTVEESRMANYDPQNVEHLSHIWSVFSKASDLCEDGKRMENLTWRLWGRASLCCSPNAINQLAPLDRSTTSTFFTQSVPSQLPGLSRSPGSDCSADSTSSNISHDSNIRMSQMLDHQNCRYTSAEKSKTKIRPDMPTRLQSLVHSIKDTQALEQPFSSLHMPRLRTLSPPQEPFTDPLPEPSSFNHSNQTTLTQANFTTPHQQISSPPRPVHVNTDSSTSTNATATTAVDSLRSCATGSESSTSSNESVHSVVRGFTPGTGTTSYTSKSQLALEPRPIPRSISASRETPIQRSKKGMFLLGGSSGEEESSFRHNMSPTLHPSSMRNQPSTCKKQTSFKDEVIIMKNNYPANRTSAVFESDDEDSECESDVSESAIEDDEDAWEDDSDEVKDEDKEIRFVRVDSTANLASRRSMLTLTLEEQRSGGRLQNANSRSTPAIRRSRTSTPNGPSIPASPEPESMLDMRAAQIQRSKPILLNTPANQPLAPVHSPRTARRNMLAGELSESLRKDMLWERQQKNPLGIAHIKRAHTSCDMKNLPKLSETSDEMSSIDTSSMPKDGKKLPWNHYFENGNGEYNQNGW